MILVIKNGKVIGVDKTLLKVLDADFSNISSLINSIELEIAALKNTDININNKPLKVIKKDLLSLENIEVFEFALLEKAPTIQEEIQPIKTIEPLEQIEPLETIKPIEPLEPIEPITPIETTHTEELPAIEKEELPTIEEFEEKITIEEVPSIEKISPEEIKPITPSTQETPKPKEEFNFEIETKKEIIEELPKQAIELEIAPKEETKEHEEISISFEDEISEVEKILSLSNKEAKELIQNDLNQAKEELGIDDNMANELLEELFKQIESEKTSFHKALSNRDYDMIHKTAHKLKGAALNLRLSKLAYILKIIDEKSKQRASIDTLKKLINKFYEFFDKINEKPTTKPKIPTEIQQLIKKTLQEYLETQNEKKFKKDKKYIEKLLNTKINSIEDLKNILKGN